MASCVLPSRATSTTTTLCCVLCVAFLKALLFGYDGAAAAMEQQQQQQQQQPQRSIILAQLKRINKPAVRSLKSPDGDVIDCVDINKQPAFDHPLLKGTKLQLVPSNAPWKEDDGGGSSSAATSVRQLWHHRGQMCPNRTVPIRRTLESDISRQQFPQRYGTKLLLLHGGGAAQPPPFNITLGAPGNRQHEHAIAYVQGEEFYGAEAVINVWSPSVEVPDEFSLSQIWVLAGKFDLDLNSVEAGWQVNPVLYGDLNPRFFTYWTRDGYKYTGCYNLICQGFVQVNNRIVLGGTIAPISSTNHAQYDIRILIFKDFLTGNWWLRYGEELVGYWPGVLFTHLTGFASVVEWGGEVVNSRPGKRHTSTQMGSGEFAQSGFGRASYLRNLQVVDFTGSLRSPANVKLYATQPSCYSIQRSADHSLYFGGPGFCSACP